MNKRVFVDIDEELHYQLKLKCLKERTSIKVVVTQLLTDYMKKGTKDNAKEKSRKQKSK